MSEGNTEVESNEDKDVILHSGEAMTIAESREITRSRETSLVVLAGAPEAGKTTLVASLFHRYQRGPFAGLMFAGSNTCVGLDRRCHLSRTKSRGTDPDTERTKYGDPKRLLHFRLRREDLTEPAKDVLLSDISGEEYDEIRNSVEECRNFPLFVRADHLVLLVDGERIANPSERHGAKAEIEQLMRCLFDAGQLNQQRNVYVLIGKYDLIDSEQARRFATRLKDQIRERYGNEIDNLYLGDVAARPKRETDEFGLAYGLEIPLMAWLDRPESRIDLAGNYSREHCHSEFDRMLLRQRLKEDVVE